MASSVHVGGVVALFAVLLAAVLFAAVLFVEVLFAEVLFAEVLFVVVWLFMAELSIEVLLPLRSRSSGGVGSLRLHALVASAAIETRERTPLIDGDEAPAFCGLFMGDSALRSGCARMSFS